MFVKFIVLSLLASISLQSPVSNEGSIIDDAKDALQKLADKIEQAISTAINTLKAILQDLIIYADEIIKQYTFKIEEEFKKLLEQLGKIKDDAAKGHVDIADCLKNNEANFMKLPGKYTAKMVQCVTDKITEAKKIVADTTKDILGTMTEIDQLRNELGKCGKGIEALACATKIMAKVSALGISLPIKITAEVAKATQLLVTLKLRLKECAAENVISMVAEGTEILANITNCVNAKNSTGSVYSDVEYVNVISLDYQ